MKYKTKLNMKKTTAGFVSASIILSSSLTNISIVSADDTVQIIDTQENTSGSAIVIDDNANQDIEPATTEIEIFDENDFYYMSVEDGKSIVMFQEAGKDKLERNSFELTIPEYIGGDKVVSIEPNAFKNKDIQKLTLPNTLVKIGSNAFSGNKLTELIIPDSVTSIGDSAFSGDKENAKNQITEITLGSNIETIGNFAFRQNAITSITIPSTVTSIGDFAFESNSLEILEIPSSVVSIGESAFTDNILNKVTIPDSVKFIGNSAFKTNFLSTITIPENSITVIGNSVFENNTLNEVIIPSTVTSIGESAFESNLLESIEIPTTITSIGESAFADNKLSTITIPDGVVSIGDNAFESNLLESIEIPTTITSIGNSVFKDNKLKNIEIPDTVTTIGDFAFEINALKSIEISDNVTSIGIGAFRDNELTSVIIPNTVTSLGYCAFSDNNLKYIKFKDCLETDETAIDVIQTAWLNYYNDYEYSGVSTIQNHGISTWSTSLPHTYDNFVDCEILVANYDDDLGGYVPDLYNPVSPEFYVRYPIDIKYSLKDGSTFEGFTTELITDVSETGWTDFSFLTLDDLENKLGQLKIIDENGFEVIDWEIVTKKGIDTLEIDGQTYIMGDVEVKPIYDKDIDIEISFEVTESSVQTNLLISNTDASIYFKGPITQNEAFDFSLTENYMFIFGDEFKVTVGGDANVIYESFEGDADYWRYMFDENKTRIFIKAPNNIDEKKPVEVKIDNVGIKDVDNIFGHTEENNVKVFLNKNNIDELYDIIATLTFEKSIEVLAVQPNNVNGKRTDSSGSITVKSNVRYSITDNELFEIKLDDGFRFINDTPDVDDPGRQGDYINITNTGSNENTIYVQELADFDDDSKDWQYTYSADYSTIYISTPIGLHGELKEIDLKRVNAGWGLNKTVSDEPTVDLEVGIEFTVSHLGVSVLDSTKFTGEIPVNYTVTNGVDFTQKGLFATLVAEEDGGSGGGNGGGGSGGGGGGHKPNKDKPTVEPEKPEEIETLIDPYIFGYTDGSVRPNGNITRAEVAQVVYNIYGNNKAVNKAILNNYSDINTNAWYSDAVAYATQAGVFEGYNDKTFKPNSPISREEVSAIIDRLYFDEIVSYGNLDIKLSDIQNSWAKEDIEYLVSKSIITGYPDGTFKPKQSIERDEFVVMMNKLTDRPKEYEVKTTFYDLSSNEWNYEDMMNASNYAIEK